ncbi:hypothetical protein CEXT_521991 [Caerostris extrusa]|uniref:Uncharacterized protein n=1 Tax=Caerostris extrusa TaxID=172846 RepID=A0AAV4Q4H8_CAEEX|nr:hypothetical protein CEXT_521991 [Caerostris extrusa]
MEHAFASYRALSLRRVVTAVHANCQNTRLAVRRCHYQHLFTGGGWGKGSVKDSAGVVHHHPIIVIRPHPDVMLGFRDSAVM